jgi:hypothetical protein
MLSQYCNGYTITGNHAAAGRMYHVCNAAGAVVARVAGAIGHALAHAEALPPGDVVEPPPPPQPELVTRAPKPKPAPQRKAAKKSAKKAPKRAKKTGGK